MTDTEKFINSYLKELYDRMMLSDDINIENIRDKYIIVLLLKEILKKLDK